MVDWLRLVYIKLFLMPVARWKAWLIFFAACLWGFFASWWMQEQGWP